MFLSAFVPMYIIVLVKTILDAIDKHTNITNIGIVIMIVLGVLILIGVVGIICILKVKKVHTESIKVISADNVTGQYFFGYFSLFVLLAVNFDMYNICDSTIFFIINIMIGIVYIHNNLYYINPLLNVLGYNIYKITYIDRFKESVNINVFIKNKINKDDSIDIKTIFNYNFCVHKE